MGLVGAAALSGMASIPARLAAATIKSVPTPVGEEGPFWVDEHLNRSDIRNDPATGKVEPGLPLNLTVNVALNDKNGVAKPLKGARVDLWQCNASGVYSDEDSQDSLGKKYLRGFQVSDELGNTKFTTIYPGWYNGRTVHIHCRVRMYSGNTQTREFTTQFFFNEEITAAVYKLPPYSARAADRDTFNNNDHVFDNPTNVSGKTTESGDLMMIRLSEDKTHCDGVFNLVLDDTVKQAMPQGPGGGPDGFGGPGGPGGDGPPNGPGGPGDGPGGPPPGDQPPGLPWQW